MNPLEHHILGVLDLEVVTDLGRRFVDALFSNMFILPAPIIHALLFATYSWALGINCRGTTDCTSIRNFAKDQGFLPANEINKSIQSMSDEAFYMDQQPIGARFQARATVMIF